jgi:sigma-E factor negative regulatory protein RseA
MNPETPAPADDASWLISALADGEVDAGDCVRACAEWSDAGSAARRRWHAYHLIGDVLRSEDLSIAPEHDRAFLERLRTRLADDAAMAGVAQEPPAPAVRPGQRPHWAMPMALAAGIMGLATVLVLTQLPRGATPSSAPVLAAASAGADAAVATASALPTPAVAEASLQAGRIVRDAQLDRYLRAHRDYGAGPGSLPGGSGRSIATVSLER